jgi:hypothetical protein
MFMIGIGIWTSGFMVLGGFSCCFHTLVDTLYIRILYTAAIYAINNFISLVNGLL